MRVYLINVVCGTGSTGRIVTDISRMVAEQGGDCRIAYGRGTAPEDVNSYKISGRMGVYCHAMMTRLTDRHGLYSKNATKRLIEDIKRFRPDVIHLHNIHGYYLNYKMLFAFLKEKKIPVVWTLHDCWAFTGHCAHFTAAGCNKWQQSCSDCVELRRYPVCLFGGNVTENFQTKKASFTGLERMQLVVPSHWLREKVRQSFLKEYPVETVYNAINLGVFKPMRSAFREQYGLQDKKIVLGVSSIWNARKGLNTMLQLARRLDEQYAVVLAGVTGKQKRAMPENVVAIEKTSDARELAAIYAAADVFVNPSLEETFGLTTLEAIACGTPAIVWKGTACEEVASLTGAVAIEQDIEVLAKAVRQPHERPVLHNREMFSRETYGKRMMELYENIISV